MNDNLFHNVNWLFHCHELVDISATGTTYGNQVNISIITSKYLYLYQSLLNIINCNQLYY